MKRRLIWLSGLERHLSGNLHTLFRLPLPGSTAYPVLSLHRSNGFLPTCNPCEKKRVIPFAQVLRRTCSPRLYRKQRHSRREKPEAIGQRHHADRAMDPGQCSQRFRSDIRKGCFVRGSDL